MTTTIKLTKEQLIDVTKGKLQISKGKLVAKDPNKNHDAKNKKKTKPKKKRDFELTHEQRTIVDDIKKWFSKNKGYSKYEFGGYAGVGKSTVIDFLLEELDLAEYQVRLCAPTGTASLVLKDKTPDYSSCTLHKLFYIPKRTNKGVIFEPTKMNVSDAKLIIIDESSMVGRKVANEILEIARKARCKVLIVGDPGQLPPVGDDEFFFLDPDAMLTEIMRQAAGNPIIDLSMKIRQASENAQSYQFKPGIVGDNLYVLPQAKMTIRHLGKVINNGGAVLCGANKTRASLNRQIRQELGFDKPGVIMEGEKICIKKNYPENEDGIEVTNGMVGTATNISTGSDELGKYYKFTFTPDKFNGSRKMIVRMDILFEEKNAFYNYVTKNRRLKAEGKKPIQIGAQATLGYAITCHSSQGSQWDTVVLFDESHMFGRDKQGNYHEESYFDQNRWLYTAVTRAAKNLIVFI